MSGSTATPAVLGASTTVAGIAVLPNTNGNMLLTVVSIAMIAAGVIVMGSFTATRLASKFLR